MDTASHPIRPDTNGLQTAFTSDLVVRWRVTSMGGGPPPSALKLLGWRPTLAQGRSSAHARSRRALRCSPLCARACKVHVGGVRLSRRRPRECVPNEVPPERVEREKDVRPSRAAYLEAPPGAMVRVPGRRRIPARRGVIDHMRRVSTSLSCGSNLAPWTHGVRGSAGSSHTTFDRPKGQRNRSDFGVVAASYG
jgi:hypothetical protein